MRSWIKYPLWAFFFLSGATALLYEIVWMRELILVFGSTSYAVSSVLSAFMLGLAIGSFALGRAADRGSNLAAIYGLLEIGVGLYALIAPVLLAKISPLFLTALGGGDPSPGTTSTAARFVGSLAILLPPTILMGGTLPVLSRLFADPEGEHAGIVGRLYAVNTFGAVAGTFLTGFVLLPNLGMSRTTLLAAAVNVTLGVAALIVSRSRQFLPASWPARTSRETGGAAPDGSDPRPAASPHRPARRPARALVLAVFALSGFAAMLYEVGWTRVLALTIGSSVYGFTLMLVAFLAGLAAGAALLARYAARPGIDAARALGFLLAGVAAASWATSLLFGSLPYMFACLFTWTNGANLLHHAAQLGLCMLIMFPATLLMGGVFPLILRLHAERDAGVGRRVGEAYAANTVGTVLGAAAAGFLLLPVLGVRTTLLLAVAIDLALAGVLFAAASRSPLARMAALPAAGLTAALFALLAPAWDPLMMNSGIYNQAEILPAGFTRRSFVDFAVGKDSVLYYKEGVTASVLVARDGRSGSLYLKVNGKADASTGIDMRTQVLLGQLPMLFHPAPRDALVIGLASGISVASTATHPVEKIRVVEVEPAMIDACRVFDEHNRRILDDPRVTVVINDARNDVQLRRDDYDVIISEPSNPWMTVASNLFTLEFFRAARAKLRPGGIFGQWFQVYSLAPEDLRSLLATFRQVFPHVAAFSAGDASDLIVLGSDVPITFDHGTLEARMSDLHIAVDLARVGVHYPEDFLAFLYIATPELDEYVHGATLNTDDNALIEFSAPLSLYSETIWANQRELLRHRPPLARLLQGLPEDPASRREIYLNLAEGFVLEDRPRGALEALDLAEALGTNERSRRIRARVEARIPPS